MIYLDHGATSFPKPEGVIRAVTRAMETCANPGRGGHDVARDGARAVFSCRQEVADFFDCQPEQVVFTQNCTHGLNMAIRTLVRPGDRVVISGFEHNAVTRPLHQLRASIQCVWLCTAGRGDGPAVPEQRDPICDRCCPICGNGGGFPEKAGG